MSEMSDASSRSKLSQTAVASWQVPLPLPSPPGMSDTATGSPIRVGSTGTIVSLMEREQAELKRSKKEEQQEVVMAKKLPAGTSRLRIKTETISISCGLPLMAGRAPGASGARARAKAKLRKTHRRQQLLQRDFRSCRVPKDGETPGFITRSAGASWQRRRPSADSMPMLLDAGSLEADPRAAAQELMVSDCRIGRRPSRLAHQQSAGASSAEEEKVKVQGVITDEPCLRRGNVETTVSVKGSRRVALLPFSPEGSRRSPSSGKLLQEADAESTKHIVTGGGRIMTHNSPEELMSSGAGSPSLQSTPSSGRPSSVSKSSSLQQDSSTRFSVEGRRSDATNNSSPRFGSQRESVDGARHSTSSENSWLREAVLGGDLRPSTESSPISIEELRRSLMAERASTKRVQQSSPSLAAPATAASKSSPVYKLPQKDGGITLRIPAPEPFQGQLYRESPRLREFLRKSPRLREMQQRELPRLSDLRKESPPRLRERFSPKPAVAVAQLQSLPVPAGVTLSKPYHHVVDKVHRQPMQNVHQQQQQSRLVHKALLPNNPTTTLKPPGSSSSRVLPFFKSDTDDETEVGEKAQGNKSRNQEGASTPLTGSGKLKQSSSSSSSGKLKHSSSSSSSRKQPAIASISCSRPSWTKTRDRPVLS